MAGPLDGVRDFFRSLDPQEKLCAAGAALALTSAAAGAALATLVARKSHANTLRQVRLAHARAKDQVDRARKFAHANFANDMIPVADNFDAFVGSLETAVNVDPGITRGAALTRRSLLDALASHHVSRLDVAPGDAFDPAFMEAMYVVQPVQGGVLACGAVATLVCPGYKLHDRLLRAAQVSVVDKSQVVVAD